MNQQISSKSEVEKDLQHHIEERQQAEAQLKAECDFIEAVLNTIETLIVVLDKNGRIIRFNRACQTLTGYTFFEVKNRLFWDIFFVPEEKQQIKALFAKLTTSQSANEGNHCWTTKDGRRRLISWSNTVLLDANGEVEYIISAGKDITEREQTILLLHASDSLRRVTTALLQHITTLDDVLSIVCKEALQLTTAAGSAVLLQEDETWLRVTSSSGDPLPILERLPMGESFAGLVMGQGKPLLLNDPIGEMQAYHRNPDLKTLLAVPLCVDDEVLGALDVVNKPGGFTDEDIQVMQLFADQAAVAIEYAQLYQQAEKLAVIEERQRLSRELHDSVTQSLYSINLYTEAAQMALLAGKTDVTANNLQELRNMAREANLDMRMLIFELHQPVWEEEGLASALQARLEAVEARSGLQTEFHVEGERRLSLSIEEELYRIVQEALTNAVKHAKASKVIVRLHAEQSCFYLEVQDDGLGFDLIKARKGGGLGLHSIEERVQRINGKLAIDSFVGQGTTLRVEVMI